MRHQQIEIIPQTRLRCDSVEFASSFLDFARHDVGYTTTTRGLIPVFKGIFSDAHTPEVTFFVRNIRPDNSKIAHVSAESIPDRSIMVSAIAEINPDSSKLIFAIAESATDRSKIVSATAENFPDHSELFSATAETFPSFSRRREITAQQTILFIKRLFKYKIYN